MITYQTLGLRPFINASGTLTRLGGSLMGPEVVDAMREAAEGYADIDDLNAKAGKYLAGRIGVEAAAISCGAASGMQLSAAACLTGTDAERVLKLPHTDGWKNEFVISLVDTHTYVHQGIEMCGGKLVRAGSTSQVTTDDLLGGIGEKTAAVVHFLAKQGTEQLEQVIAGATERGVPVVVDAAAQLPPRSNLHEIVGMGASLVVFSGGKGMRGPQNSGLVLGKTEFVEAVRLNASPQNAIGRGMKVGKEEILGLVTAVDRFLHGDDEEDRTTWGERASHMCQALQGIAGVRASVTNQVLLDPDFAPRVLIELEERNRFEPAIRALWDGDPSIAVYGDQKGIVVDAMTLRPGEEVVVARRLQEVLKNG